MGADEDDRWQGNLVGRDNLAPSVRGLLLDRGMDPQSAINWLNANGYGTAGAWYPGPNVIGFSFDYMALNPITGVWDLITKAGA